MTTEPEGQAPLIPRPGSHWALLRWPVTAALLALGLAVAAPRASPPEVASSVAPAGPLLGGECGPQAMVLPPGHPPVAGVPSGELRQFLPPGHPPIGGGPAGNHPLLPDFSSPESVDL
jgi:hypothetical protein